MNDSRYMFERALIVSWFMLKSMFFEVEKEGTTKNDTTQEMYCA